MCTDTFPVQIQQLDLHSLLTEACRASCFELYKRQPQHKPFDQIRRQNAPNDSARGERSVQRSRRWQTGMGGLQRA